MPLSVAAHCKQIRYDVRFGELWAIVRGEGLTGMKRSFAAVMCLSGALMAGACAAPRGEGELIADPYVDTNRQVHAFNKGLDQAILKPVSEAYDFVTPATLKLLLSNGLDHLRLPGMFVNRALQGDVEAASIVLGRFSVNTVAGAGGLLDPATEFGLPFETTDFGVTLATWGAEEGPYVEAPFFGPSTTRHAIGRFVNFALDPSILLTTGAVEVGTALTIASNARTPVDIVNARHENAEIINDVFYKSDDSYVTARTGYIQNRRRLVSGGETDTEELPDIFD